MLAPRPGQYALVSGGSEGIGLGIADALAGYGVNVALVSRSADKLARAAAFLKERHPGVEVVTVAVDLTGDGATDKVGGRARGEGPALSGAVGSMPRPAAAQAQRAARGSFLPFLPPSLWPATVLGVLAVALTHPQRAPRWWPRSRRQA